MWKRCCMRSAEPVKPSRPHFTWQLATRTLDLGERTRVMGIVNVTPDSFSDGGVHGTTQAAISHALKLLDEGADILDIGGESTRPGTAAGTPQAIAGEEEQRRVLPVMEGVLRARPDALLSVDTYRASTARLAVQAGAEIVNDVSGLLWDEAMAGTLAALRCGVVVMHTRGLPSEWSDLPPLGNDEILPMILQELHEAAAEAEQAGVARDRIVLDPGFGFGKRGAENWTLLAQFDQLACLSFPLLAGLSRKGFLAHTLEPQQRDAATHAAHALAIRKGAHIVRVHDVAGARAAADEIDIAAL